MAGFFRRTMSEFPSDGGAAANNFHRSLSDSQGAGAGAGDDADAAEAALREQFRKDVLKLRFCDVPKSKLIRLLDENPETVIELGLQLGFSKLAVNDMNDKQFGAGQPHARFVDLLLSKHFSVEYVKEGMLDAGIPEVDVNRLFAPAEPNRYQYFSDFQPRDAVPFHRILREDMYNTDQPCWKHVAEALGMDDIIPSICSTRFQGGMHSIGNSFCKILVCQNIEIQEFKDDIEGHLSRMQEDEEDEERIDVMQQICDSFNVAIEDKVKTMIKVIKEKEKRRLRRQALNFARNSNQILDQSS